METPNIETTASATPDKVRNEWETVNGGVNPPAGYTLWTRQNAGERIWTFRQTNEGTPTPDSGGYFSIETAAKVKGFKMESKRTIPAEKPTDRSTEAQWEALANESIADAGYWKAEARKAQAHAAQLAEALHSTAHDIADAMLWIADSESTPARKFEGVAVCLRHSQQQRVQALAAYESEVR